jgi:hypothetical protein
MTRNLVRQAPGQGLLRLKRNVAAWGHNFQEPGRQVTFLTPIPPAIAVLPTSSAGEDPQVKAFLVPARQSGRWSARPCDAAAWVPLH